VRVTLVGPGITDTGFWGDASPPAFALAPTAIAATVGWLLDQPAGADVTDLVVRPIGQLI
jgi:NADP-dependent 3-hydroxy acid dehydrogenase YdfG